MKNKFNLIVISIFLIFCFIIFYKGLDSPNIYVPKTNIEKDLPVFKAKDFNSNTDTNSEKIFADESYYIVNVWASWCIPCRKEHPLLMELSKNKSIKLVGLNYKDSLKNAKIFISEFGNPYSQILIDNDGTLGIEFGAYGVPETFLIDKNKKIIEKFVGPINKKIVEEIKIITK